MPLRRVLAGPQKQSLSASQFYLRIFDVGQDATVPVASCPNQYNL
jgi:hypothetical protein